MALWEKGPDPISLPFDTSSVIINADGEGNAEIKLVVETPVSLDPASGAGSSTLDFSKGKDFSAGFTGEGISSATFQRLKNFVSAQSGSGSASCVINITEFLEFAGTFNGVGTASSTLTLKEFVDLVGSFTGDGSGSCTLTLETFSTYHEWLDGYLNDQNKPANAIWTSDPTSGSTDEDYLNNHDGTLNGSPTLGADPVVDDSGNSFDFDGSDDYSSVSDSSSLEPGTSDNFTIMGWCDVSSSASGLLATKAETSSGPGYALQLQLGNDRVRYYVEEQDFDSPFVEISTTSSGVFFMAGILDRGNEEWKGWLNNGTTGTDSASGLNDVSSSDNLRFGADDGVSGEELTGKIDVRSYIPYALTNTELQKIYDVGINNSNA